MAGVDCPQRRNGYSHPRKSAVFSLLPIFVWCSSNPALAPIRPPRWVLYLFDEHCFFSFVQPIFGRYMAGLANAEASMTKSEITNRELALDIPTRPSANNHVTSNDPAKGSNEPAR